MSDAPGPLTHEVRKLASRSVLCWLATVDEQGRPNVSPKEVWSIMGDDHVVVAHIASPVTARNIAKHPQVCLSFVDVFLQKGYKLQGTAREVSRHSPGFADWAAPLLVMVGNRFMIRSVLVITAESARPILAPSYRFYPDTVTEAAQVSSAMHAYGVAALESPK
jgi:predicted pyridoxine 5'-phosphate oxidase superfamily flavin-nucleotide-binding protein